MQKNYDSPSGSKTSVWLVEDDVRFRANLRDLINEVAGLQCDLAVASCEEVLAHLLSDAVPDTLLMDIGLPGLDGIEGVRRAKSIAPSVQVIMLTVFDDNDRIFRAICAGASGYLLKSAEPDAIIRSLKEILEGGAPMNAQIARKVLEILASMAAPTTEYGITGAEKRILQMLVKGDLKKQIAFELGVSFHTVDTHLRNIYAKLQVHSRSGAIAKALKERLL